NFDRALADFAFAVAAAVGLFERLVHLLEQLDQVGGLGTSDRSFELLLPQKKLVTKKMKVRDLDTHGTSPQDLELWTGRQDSIFYNVPAQEMNRTGARDYSYPMLALKITRILWHPQHTLVILETERPWRRKSHSRAFLGPRFMTVPESWR